jgi:methionyl aminopeptidase
VALIKSEEEIVILREAGKRLARVLREVSSLVVPGVQTSALNSKAEDLIRAGGDIPAFLNYQPEGARRPYPATLCVSVNDEVVHGLPNENNRALEEGDIVGLDCGLTHKGLIVDSAMTVPVGHIDEESQRLISTTQEALESGIKASLVGSSVGDIGRAIEFVAVKSGYGVPTVLGGHGVGHKVHEDPYIPNLGRRGEGMKLEKGMVLALEPMLNLGTGDVVLADDGFTYSTADGRRSAHFEHTIVITNSEAEILTKI